MSMFSFFARKPKETRSTPLRGADIITLGGEPSDSGIIINEKTALQSSAVYSCIQVIAETIGSLPIFVYRRTEDGRVIAREHPAFRLLHEAPNEQMTRSVFIECLVGQVLSYGNALAFIDKENERPTAVYPLNPATTKPTRHNGILKYEVSIEGQSRLLDPSQVIHIPGFTFNGVWGLSPIQNAQRTIGLSIAADKFGAKWFASGSQQSGILTHPQRLSDQARENLRESLNRKHQGLDNAFKFLILQEGMTFTPLTIPQEQAQFIETRKYQLRDICRLFRVPPHLVADLEGGASFASIEHQGISFYQNTIRPWVVKFEQEFTRKLIQESEKPDYYAEFEIAALLRGDQQSQDESFAAGLNNGWYSINEVRRMKNLPQIVGGDLHYRPLNMAAVEVKKEQDEDTGNEIHPDPTTEA